MAIEDASLLREINRKLDDVQATVNTMNGVLFGSGQPGVEGFMQTTSRRLDAHARRLTSLDKWKWMITGGWAVIAFLIAHHMLAGVK